MRHTLLACWLAISITGFAQERPTFMDRLGPTLEVAQNEPKKMTKPRKAMADIPDSSRTDDKGLQSLRPYVIQLESMMRWEANDAEWKGRRDGWAQEVLKARYVTNLAKLMLEMEENTSWDAVNADWEKQRPGWIKKVKAARTRKNLCDAIEQYEAALKWEYMQDDWSTARDGWVENVKGCQKG